MRFNRRGLLITTLLLTALGVVMVYSTSAVYAQDRTGDAAYFLKRHLLYLVMGLALSVWILELPAGRIRKWVKPMLGVAVALLVLVLIPGIGARVSGAARWFRLGPFSFQPSEFAQLALILYLADFLSRKRADLNNFLHGLLPVLLVSGGTIGLILVGPDLGTSVATASVVLILLFVAGVRGKLMVPMLLSAVPLVIAGVLLKPYRMRRIAAYLNPWADPEGAGFQLIQSLVALGSGGWFGVGLGESRQKLFYLPAAHTDFIFSVIGEELGFFGATAALLLLLALAWFGLQVAMRAPDTFGFFAGVGIVSLLMLEALIHIGVAGGALPTKGLPLPFISYGGTALIINLASIAILLHLSKGPEAEAALEIRR
ncbi:MAG: putative lipid II flippase FtsW [Candidatus Omnitrophica bacterium CG11_big_fil_rev_8_21_14_0_20_64_10]|nr:MAG: putative lipid II flippase FtsW [Candidatus Omnitrophica bacterium CG11_big_fil_rev_8_21_14_0_20_64_10]